METLRQMVFVLLAFFLQLEINLFSFVFFILFFLQLPYWIPDLFRESLGG